jgi:predicted nucleic acid-binding protein
VKSEAFLADLDRSRHPAACCLLPAACCLSQGLPLVTRNVKDFRPAADHHGLTLIAE